MTLWEVGEQCESSYDADNYCWITKTELFAKMKAYQNPEVALYCEKQLTGAPTRKHTEKRRRKDPDFNQFRILKESIDGTKSETANKSGYSLKASVDPEATTEALQTCAQSFGLKRKRDEDTPEKEHKESTKGQRLPIHEQRMKKRHCDIAHGKTTNSKPVAYRLNSKTGGLPGADGREH